MPRKTGTKIIKVTLNTSSLEFIEALDKAGFADAEHFIKQSVRALLEAHRRNQKIKWPIEFEASGGPIATGYSPLHKIVDEHGGNTPIVPPKVMQQWAQHEYAEDERKARATEIS